MTTTLSASIWNCGYRSNGLEKKREKGVVEEEWVARRQRLSDESFESSRGRRVCC